MKPILIWNLIIIKIMQKMALKIIKDQKQNRIKELKGRKKESKRKLIRKIRIIKATRITDSYKPMDLTFLQNQS